jgi:hypothetical protein
MRRSVLTLGRHRCCPNPKFEYRNPKQARMTQTQNSKRTRLCASVSIIGALSFGFVSNFGFRASRCPRRLRARPTLRVPARGKGASCFRCPWGERTDSKRIRVNPCEFVSDSLRLTSPHGRKPILRERSRVSPLRLGVSTRDKSDHGRERPWLRILLSRADISLTFSGCWAATLFFSPRSSLRL